MVIRRDDATHKTGRGGVAGRWTGFIYFLLGQAAWFACVMSAARGASWMGLSFLLLLLAAHLWRAPRPIDELNLVLGVTVIGAAWESALVHFGVLEYPHGAAIAGLAPVWIVALWAMFAAQFNTTYAWLKPRILTAAVLGAVAGPLSFRAGAALGAVRFLKSGDSVGILALGWAALLPAVVLLARRWDGVQR